MLGNRRERSDGRGDDDLRIGRTMAETTGRRGGRATRWKSDGEIRGMASKTTVTTTTKTKNEESIVDSESTMLSRGRNVTKRDLIWSHL